jgi:hypothetical protein
LKPDYAEAYFNAAIVSFDMGAYSQAENYLEKAKTYGFEDYNRFEQQLINAR